MRQHQRQLVGRQVSAPATGLRVQGSSHPHTSRLDPLPASTCAQPFPSSVTPDARTAVATASRPAQSSWLPRMPKVPSRPRARERIAGQQIDALRMGDEVAGEEDQVRLRVSDTAA